MDRRLLVSFLFLLLINGKFQTVQSYEINSQFTNSSSQITYFSEFEGKYVLVDAMATWCGPCRVEMIHLQDIYDHTDDNENFVMLSISMDSESDTIQKVKDFMDEFDAKWDYGLDHNGELFREFAIDGYPTTIFLDENGEVIKKWLGITDSVEILSVMDDYIEIEGELARDLKLNEFFDNLLSNPLFVIFLVMIWMFIIYSIVSFISKINRKNLNKNGLLPNDE